jgi:hypothetical protein
MTHYTPAVQQLPLPQSHTCSAAVATHRLQHAATCAVDVGGDDVLGTLKVNVAGCCQDVAAATQTIRPAEQCRAVQYIAGRLLSSKKTGGSRNS